MKVTIYIKGKCKGNPRGEGKAVAVIEYIDHDGICHTRNQVVTIQNDTPNALLLKSAIAAMRQLVKPCEITLSLDCNYLKNAIAQNWMEAWQCNGWERANKKPLANIEDWKQFYMLTQIHRVQTQSYQDRYDCEIKKRIEEEKS